MYFHAQGLAEPNRLNVSTELFNTAEEKFVEKRELIPVTSC
jgi:hypothetical protein